MILTATGEMLAIKQAKRLSLHRFINENKILNSLGSFNIVLSLYSTKIYQMHSICKILLLYNSIYT